MNALTICNTPVRQLGGLYSLNDLHAAAGGEKRHQPSDFLRLDQTQALVSEIVNSGNHRSLEITTGRNGGTYACRELVIAYAAWISAAFHLKVIRVFLDATTPGRPARALPPPRRIRKRDDLSFTARDANGALINWVVPSRAGSYHEHAAIGEQWFAEVAQLAQQDPQEAYEALRFSGRALLRYIGHGHEDGFMERFAIWAVAALVANKGVLPSVPVKPLKMGAGGVYVSAAAGGNW